jgi:Ca2+-transporting ATPase
MKKWYGRTIKKVVQALGSDVSLGLDENKIKYMRETYGDNIILKPKIESLLTLITHEIKHLWVLVSVIFIAMLFYNGLPIIGYSVVITMIISITLLINANYKDGKSLLAIDNLNTTFSNVKRNGKSCSISCEEMVVGDIIFLEKGSRVPADIRIIECEDLKVKQDTVTGEKFEVEKYCMKIEGEVLNLSSIKNLIFKSSVITEGYGLGIVIATGMNTQIGKVVKVLLQYKNESKHFNKKITKIANRAAIITIAAVIYIFMTFNSPIFIIMVFLFFNIIFVGFKKKNIYIKNVWAIYKLSNISVIFTKKIGSVSQNKLIFREVYCDNILNDVENQSLTIYDGIERIMSIALLCNNSNLETENDNSVERLAEIAILEFYNDKSVIISEIDSEEILEIPYDSDKRIKTVVNKLCDRYRANVKGTLDSLLNKCTHILINGIEKEINDANIQDIIKVHIDMSNKAYNVVALGYRNFNYEPSIHENIESNLVFVGLMGFENPIKESSYDAIKICKSLNIRPIIDEEDNKLASLAFGKKIGLTRKKEEILSGIEIDYMSDEELQNIASGVSIFSKISPKHKSQIVNSLNYKGHSIAAVGDKLTDLEYLSNSYISISVGNGCSNVVRKLSSLFLNENDFSEIINLVKHSKKLISYVSKLRSFIFTVGLSEISIILMCIITRGVMPFTLISILYLNFLFIPLCGISILLQNRNAKENTKRINYKDIRTDSIKISFVFSCIYLLILGFIDNFFIMNIQQFGFSIFILYQNLLCLTLIKEKHFFKNKFSYTLLLINLIFQSIFIVYLIK